jgi:hypothetical protein
MPDALDFTKGTFIPCLVVEYDQTSGAGEVIATMPVAQLLEFVPSPEASEDPKRQAEDPRLKQTAQLRREVQRAVEGAKAKNALRFAEYLVEGYENKRPTMLPAITLYHPEPLDLVDLGGGLKAVILPFGDLFVCIDGETQRIAHQKATNIAPALNKKFVKVVIHFGKAVQVARQGFYDLNTREVKPNAAVSISMDTLDPATMITRKVILESEVLQKWGVNLTRRQLRSTDREVLTISALRTGIVTTMFGSGGLAVGNRPTADRLSEFTPEQLEALSASVVEVWVAVLEQLEPELARRSETVVAAPALLAGIGILAHHAVSSPPRKTDKWTIAEILERLADVNWSRLVRQGDRVSSPWDGIAGKFTPSGSFSIGGPKEVGHAVGDALENRGTAAGTQIRMPGERP